MNWYKKSKTIIAYENTDISQYFDMKKPQYGLDYQDIGHGEIDEATMWTIDFQGQLLTSGIDSNADDMTHDEAFDMEESLWQGRVTQDSQYGKISSALKTSSYQTEAENPMKFRGTERFDKEYVQDILKAEFGNDLKIYWFN